MKVKEIREEIKRLKNLGYTSHVKLNSPEYQLRGEMARLQGLSVRDSLLSKGVTHIILTGENKKTKTLDITSKEYSANSARFFLEKYGNRLLNFINNPDNSDNWIGDFGFRGWVNFVYA